MEDIRGLHLLMEDNAKICDKCRYQHVFRSAANGIWSVLNDSGVPPYRENYLATVMERITEDEMRRIVLA